MKTRIFARALQHDDNSALKTLLAAAALALAWAVDLTVRSADKAA